MPGKGTPRQAFRIDPDLTEDFKKTVSRAQPPEDMSAVVRQFIGWYVRRPGAKLPSRPPRDGTPDDPPAQADEN